MAARLVSGFPRQFIAMWLKRRCSILFHLLVPGGKWHTTMDSPVRSANRCSSHFHNRTRGPLLPPTSAVIRREVAFGYAGRGGPSEGGSGVAGDRGLDQRLEVREELPVLLGLGLPAASRPSHPTWLQGLAGPDVSDAAGDCRPGDPRGRLDLPDAPAAQREGFGRRPEAPRPLRQLGPQRRVLGTHRPDVHELPMTVGL